VIGGENDTGYFNDVWSSSDGVTWTQATASAAFSARAYHTSVVFNGKMWVIGGYDVNGETNDVWSSSDGVTWTQANASAAFPPRNGHTSVVFNNQMWVIGGENDTGYFNDVWSSSDGVTWTQATASAAFSARTGHTSVVFNNQLWVIGGYGNVGEGAAPLNDVWSSSDGVTWTQVTDSAAFLPRDSHTSVVFNNQMWVIGGYGNVGEGGAPLNDVWSSSNGVTWTQATSSAAFPPRDSHTSVDFNNQMWVIGGYRYSDTNDVWSSSDGVTWTQATASAIFSARTGHTSVVFNNQMWVIGGYDVNGETNDVWSSSDGVTWTRKTAMAGFPPRNGHTSVVFNGKIWVIGGENDTAYFNDVWSSSDGVTWTQATDSAAFSARAYHTSVVFNGKMWVIGGYNVSGDTNDVWSSSDGVTWTQATDSAAFPPRDGHTSVDFNNQMWVIGGYVNGDTNDVWSSSDGVTWTQATDSAAFPPRDGHTSIVFNNQMWVIGGENDTGYLNDVWYSGSIPVASFTADITSGRAPLTVQFTDTSDCTNPTGWQWLFGDGTTSTESSPLHTYTQYGSYSVMLNITNSSGSGTITKRGFITVNGLPGWKFHGDGQNTGIYDDGGTRPNGVEWWEYPTGSSIEMSSPAISNGTLYIGNDVGTLYALNTTTGALLWSYPTGSKIDSSPAVANGTVYFGNEAYYGTLYALNANSGVLQWSWSLFNAQTLSASPTVANGMVSIVGSGASTLFTFNATTGSQVWSAYLNGAPPLSSPAVGNGLIFACGGTWIRAIDISNGTILWSYTPGTYCRDPAFAGSTVYFGDYGDSKFHALFAENGTEAWNITLANAIRTVPAVAGGVVYVSIDRALYALDAGSGTILWTNSTAISSDVWSSPAVANGVVYVGCSDHKIYAFNTTTGIKNWDFTTGGIVESSPAVANGVLYVGSFDGKVYAIGTANLPVPVTSFTTNRTSGSTPLTVQFNDTSTNSPTSWYWIFGDGGTSTAQNVTHTYNSVGTYTVNMSASNAGGTSWSNVTNKITVLPQAPVVSFTATPTSGGAPLPVSFIDTSSGSPTGWAWYFGDENYTAPWTLVTAGAAWSPRNYFSSVTMPDGSIVLMGGHSGSGNYNDTWRSIDEGATWTLVNASSGWAKRNHQRSLVMPDGSIVLMGGHSGSGNYNDTWRSIDEGATWTLVNASSGWAARHGTSTVVMPDGSIVLFAGYDDTVYYNDTWRSTDAGTTWTQVSPDAQWSARAAGDSLAMPDDSIVLIGGSNSQGDMNDTWRSTNGGVTWTLVNASAGWAARNGYNSVRMPDGSIVLMGGNITTGEYLNDVWRSTDAGTTWTQVNASAGWTPRFAQNSKVMPNGSIILLGGVDSSGYKNDVWQLPTAGSSTASPLHTYATPGNYTVALRVYNAGGYNSTRKVSYINVTSGVTTGPIHNLNTAVNYPTIMTAIGNATAGDTLAIDSGTYNEKVNVTKPLTLVGNNTGAGLPVVDIGTPGTYTAIELPENNITLDGFVVRNSRDGVHVIGENVTVRNVTATMNNFGISLAGSQNAIIEQSTVFNNTYDGISVTSSINSTIRNCLVENNSGIGISVEEASTGTTIYNNTIRLNGDWGIQIVDSSGAGISDNVVTSNYYGIVIDRSADNRVVRNNATNNTWNGIYLNSATGNSILDNDALDTVIGNGISMTNGSCFNTIANNRANRNSGSGLGIDSESSHNTFTGNRADWNLGGTGGIYVESSSNNTFRDSLLDTNNKGFIFSQFSTNNTLFNNTVTNCTYDAIELDQSYNTTLLSNTLNWNGRGVHLSEAHNNTITSTIMLGNTQIGVGIDTNSSFNTVTDAFVNGTGLFGIYIDHGSNNRVFNLTVSDRDHGIYLDLAFNNVIENSIISGSVTSGIQLNASTGNLIANNYFNNSFNVYDNGANLWNTTKYAGTSIISRPYLGGNFWSNYNGIDTTGDGIGTTLVPYTNGGNIITGGDYLPLTNTTGAPQLVASFTSNVTSGPAPLTVTFTDTSTGSPTRWNWTFGDIGAENTSTLQNPVHIYTAKGNYTVSLTSGNAGGSNSTVVIGLIQVGLRPNASFSWSPVEPEVNQTVTFDASASVDPDGTITSWDWSFEDGTYLLNQTTPFSDHTFKEPRFYNVTLIVIDNDNFTGTTVGQVSVFAKKVTINTALNGTTQGMTAEGAQSLVINSTVIGSTGGNVTITTSSVTMTNTSTFWQNVEVRAGAVNETTPGNITVQNVTAVVMKSAPITSVLNETLGNVSVSLDITLKQYVQDAAIGVKVTQGANATTMHGFQLAANTTGNEISDIAYTVELSNTGQINDNLTSNESLKSQAVIITMSVSHDWVLSHGGTSAVHIIRYPESGDPKVLTIRYVRYDPATNLDWFEADSPDGLSIFGLITMRAQAAAQSNQGSSPGGQTSGGTTGGGSSTGGQTSGGTTGGGGGFASYTFLTKTGTMLESDEGKVLTPYVISTGAEARLTVPLGTTIRGKDGKTLSVVSVEMAAAADVPTVPAGAVYSFAGYAVKCSPDGATFNPATSLKFSLNGNEWNDLMAKSKDNTGHMVVKFYDATSVAWVSVPTTVDPVAHTVTGSVTHFSTYGLFIDTTAVTPVVIEATPVAQIPNGTGAPLSSPTPIVPLQKRAIEMDVGMFTWLFGIILGNPITMAIVIAFIAVVAYFGWWKNRI
jgi:parallel beta-helix repeat protein